MENPAWNEVAALTRLTLLVMYNIRVPVQTQLFVPEVLHLVTMIVSTGPVMLRTAVHGIVTNLVQSLCVMRTDDEVGKERLRRILKDCFKPEVLRLFGLAREDASSEYTAVDTATEQLSVDGLEKITLFLLDIVDAGAQTTGTSFSERCSFASINGICRPCKRLESPMGRPGYLDCLPAIRLHPVSRFRGLGCHRIVRRRR